MRFEVFRTSLPPYRGLSDDSPYGYDEYDLVQFQPPCPGAAMMASHDPWPGPRRYIDVASVAQLVKLLSGVGRCVLYIDEDRPYPVLEIYDDHAG